MSSAKGQSFLREPRSLSSSERAWKPEVKAEEPCRPQIKVQAVWPVVLKVRVSQVTLVVQMAPEAMRAPVKVMRER